MKYRICRDANGWFRAECRQSGFWWAGCWDILALKETQGEAMYAIEEHKKRLALQGVVWEGTG